MKVLSVALVLLAIVCFSLGDILVDQFSPRFPGPSYPIYWAAKLQSNGDRVFSVDDFVVPAGQKWIIQAASFYAFPPNVNTITEWNLQLWKENAGAIFVNTPFLSLTPTPDGGLNSVRPARFTLTSNNIILDSGTYWIGVYPTVSGSLTTLPDSLGKLEFLDGPVKGAISKVFNGDCVDTGSSCPADFFEPSAPDDTDLVFRIEGLADVSAPAYSVPDDWKILPETYNFVSQAEVKSVTFRFRFTDDQGVVNATVHLENQNDGQSKQFSVTQIFTGSEKNGVWTATINFQEGVDHLGEWRTSLITITDIAGRTTDILFSALAGYPRTFILGSSFESTTSAIVTTGQTTSAVTTAQATTYSIVTTEQQFTTRLQVTTSQQSTASTPGTDEVGSDSKGGTPVVAIVVPIVIVLLLLIVGLIIFIVILKRRRNSGSSGVSTSLGTAPSPQNPGRDYSSIALNTNATTELNTTRRFNIDPSAEISVSELQLGEVIGEGAFGTVYKGTWRNITVAIKQMKLNRDISEKQLREYYDEIALMKKMRNHINVVMLLGVTNKGHIVTEFYDKGSLYGLIRKGEKIPHEFVKKIAVGIANGMLHLHTEGIVHRDLAARNVLLTSNYEPKIADFGLARIVDHEQESVGQTQSNTGPLKHMAPESITRREYSPKSDVWSYGVVLYELLAFREPYEELDPVQTAASVAYQGLKLSLPPNVIRQYPLLNTVMQECFTFDPQRRPGFDVVTSRLRNA